MAEASISVDLANPGQVFACLGFLEAADVLLGGARGGFDWRDPENLRFLLAAGGDPDPVGRVLHFLEDARVTSVAPAGSPHSTEKWQIETRQDASGTFPCPDQGSDVLPACLTDSAGRCITIDHWGDQGPGAGRDRIKFWAGSGGYPGAGLARDALDLMRGRMDAHGADPFALGAEQSSSFRFDWRRDYVPVDAGFSPNAHGEVVMRGYPLVELLAAVGLTHARPIRRGRLEYRYGVAGVAGDVRYDPIFLRAALGVETSPFPGMPFRLFTMRLDWPGQEGQARCITDVIEETPSS